MASESPSSKSDSFYTVVYTLGRAVAVACKEASDARAKHDDPAMSRAVGTAKSLSGQLYDICRSQYLVSRDVELSKKLSNLAVAARDSVTKLMDIIQSSTDAELQPAIAKVSENIMSLLRAGMPLKEYDPPPLQEQQFITSLANLRDTALSGRSSGDLKHAAELFVECFKKLFLCLKTDFPAIDASEFRGQVSAMLSLASTLLTKPEDNGLREQVRNQATRIAAFFPNSSLPPPAPEKEEEDVKGNTQRPAAIIKLIERTYPEFRTLWKESSRDKRDSTLDQMTLLMMSDSSSVDWLTWQKTSIRMKLMNTSHSMVSLDAKSDDERKLFEQREAVLERVVKAASDFSTCVLELLVSVPLSLGRPDDVTVYKAVPSRSKECRRCLIEMLESVYERIVNSLPSGNCPPEMKNMFDKLMNTMKNPGIAGVCDNDILTAANVAGYAKQIIVGDLERAVHHQCNALRLQMAQFMAICGSLTEYGTEDIMKLVEVCATSTLFSKTLIELSNSFETARTLKLSETGDNGGLLMDDSKKDTPLWQELSSAIKKIDFDESDGTPKTATLNRLIEFLTSPVYQSKVLKTFVISSPSFSTPSVMLDKVIERYKVPDTFKEQEKIIIRLRVGVLLKYWIESQFDEFDDHLIQRLKEFIESEMMASQSDLATKLLTEIARLQADRVKRSQFFAMPSIEFFMPEEKKSPLQFFFCFDDAEIARQLTLIDYRIFSEIRPKELMNKAWDKPKLKHLAPNVTRMVSRANSLSMWVAHVILSFPTPEKRAEMCNKFVRIASHLRQQHNFNGVFVIIQALSQSYVNRLKKTWALVPADVSKELKNLNQLVAPEHSFKAYRDEIMISPPPTLPSIHVYLSDILKMEDSNENTTSDGRINFAKNVIICNRIAELQQYQNTRYPYCISEPLFSFLSELPALDDTPMYNLSLAREPRESQPREPKSPSSSSGTSKFPTLHKRG